MARAIDYINFGTHLQVNYVVNGVPTTIDGCVTRVLGKGRDENGYYISTIVFYEDGDVVAEKFYEEDYMVDNENSWKFVFLPNPTNPPMFSKKRNNCCKKIIVYIFWVLFIFICACVGIVLLPLPELSK